jgi:drug/metabolite transporter (DMT)-like permease
VEERKITSEGNQSNNRTAGASLLQGGVVLMLLASASFATMSAFVKALGPDFPVLEAVFFRGVIGLPILWAVVKGQNLSFTAADKKLMLWRSIFGTGALVCFFFAVERMALTDAILIEKVQPMFVAILAIPVLGERPTKTALIGLVAGFAGSYLVLSPTLGVANSAGLVCFLGSIFSACAHISVRKLNASEKPQVIVFHFTAFLTAFSAIAGFRHFVLPKGMQLVQLAGLGLFATVGQLLMTMAYSREKAPVVAAAGYISVAFAVLYGFTFWGEVPDTQDIVGGALIVMSGAALALSRLGAFEPSSPSGVP